MAAVARQRPAQRTRGVGGGTPRASAAVTPGVGGRGGGRRRRGWREPPPRRRRELLLAAAAKEEEASGRRRRRRQQRRRNPATTKTIRPLRLRLPDPPMHRRHPRPHRRVLRPPVAHARRHHRVGRQSQRSGVAWRAAVAPLHPCPAPLWPPSPGDQLARVVYSWSAPRGGRWGTQAMRDICGQRRDGHGAQRADDARAERRRVG